MGTRFEALEQSVGDALEKYRSAHTLGVKKTGVGMWRLESNADLKHRIECRLRGNWFFVQTPLQEKCAENSLWSCLRNNPLLSGRSKITLDPDRRAVWLRDDVPVAEEIDLSKMCVEAVTNLDLARTALDEPCEPTSAQFDSTGPAEEGFSDTLEDVCTEAGWPWSKRSDDRAVVGLDLRNASYRAALDARSRHDYRVSVGAATYKSPSGIVQLAVAVFLLTANQLVHFARAGAEETGDGAHVVFEVRFSERPSPAMLDCGLSALSVALRLFAAELRVLGEEKVARRFLRSRGWSSHWHGSL